MNPKTLKSEITNSLNNLKPNYPKNLRFKKETDILNHLISYNVN